MIYKKEKMLRNTGNISKHLLLNLMFKHMGKFPLNDNNIIPKDKNRYKRYNVGDLPSKKIRQEEGKLNLDIYFIKGFIEDRYLGISGAWDTIEHFSRDDQSTETLIYTIIKACKSLEEWTISVRLGNIKSPFRYGLSERDISKMNFDEQRQLLQYYCNAYTLLFHICKSTQNKLDAEYKEHLNLDQLQELGGGEIAKYIEKADRKCRTKFDRGLL